MPQPASQANSSPSFNWKIAGKAGEGVMVSSKILTKACKRHGLEAFNYLEYPSLIKGGHQTGQVYAAAQGASCQRRHLDLLIAFHKEGIEFHQEEITDKTVIIANTSSKGFEVDQYKSKVKAKIYPLPLFKLARETAGSSMVSNVVALGVTAHFLGLDKTVVEQLLKEEFADKGEEIVAQDLAAFAAGFEAAQKLGDPMMKFAVKPDKNILLTGNEAVGLGAIAAGLQYYSAYPMTPASGLMHYLALQQTNYPLIVKHVEDEIGAINQAIGASYAGVRAMTGTSGGGFALMVEALSLAGMTEVPLVILEAQRPGPATGLPTWTSQADLQFVLRAGHGDFQRVVLTPGTVKEHYELTKLAFYLAEKYQIPVLILSDKFILESHQTMPQPDMKVSNQRHSMIDEKDIPTDDSYRRYVDTPEGYSARSVPGQAHGLQVTNSYEHDEFGYATEEIEMTVAQADKRAKKVAGLLKEIPQPQLLGPAQAEITFVSWGSTVNVLQDLLLYSKPVNLIHLPCVWPFPSGTFVKLAKQTKHLVMVEGNATGQGEQLIRQETGITFSDHIRRYDGRPFYVEDLLVWVNQKLSKNKS